MSSRSTLPLQERIPVRNTLKRISHLAILFLLVLLVFYRLSSLRRHGLPWFLAFLCETWFTFVWLLNLNIKWNPVLRKTHPDRISKRCEDLPAVDMFVTTADPVLEPPIVTVNTVLSLLAVDYPAQKLACYVSDDACSPITYYALVEASEFAKSWVPFCRKYNARVRAPFVYFSHEPQPYPLLSSDFLQDWEMMKSRYEQLTKRIEEASRACDPLCFNDELAYLSKFDRGNHPSILKVIWVNKANLAEGCPHLIYVAREKRPKHPHHHKAGAMNALTRVSGVITNAPFMLNVDCDTFANNPEVLLHAMCLLLGFEEEAMSGFVQCPQHFHGGLKDDPFGNQFVVTQLTAGLGMDGLQGPFYLGTGCVHRRKVIYGAAPNHEAGADGSNVEAHGKFSPSELERRFGNSRELKESAAEVLSGAPKTTLAIKDLSSSVHAAQEVASCTYEVSTCWGKQVGLVYGSTTEDIQTGLRVHATGWSSVNCLLDPPGFRGNAPVGGPASMTQIKRWSTGLLEVLVGRNSPLLATLTKKLSFRECLCYLSLNVWALRSLPELCYALLAPYCVVANTSFLPKATEPAAIVPAMLFGFHNVCSLAEYLQCGQSVRAWWNNQRMQRILSSTAWLFGFLSVILKIAGISETTFEVTQKDLQHASAADVDNARDDPGRFTFDASPVFVSGTALLLLNLLVVVVGSFKILRSSAGSVMDDGPGLGELVCSAWVVLSFWPFLRGLFMKGSYGLPWATIVKGSFLGSLFLLMCWCTA